jgi:hypothetical protein
MTLVEVRVGMRSQLHHRRPPLAPVAAGQGGHVTQAEPRILSRRLDDAVEDAASAMSNQ